MKRLEMSSMDSPAHSANESMREHQAAVHGGIEEDRRLGCWNSEAAKSTTRVGQRQIRTRPWVGKDSFKTARSW